MISQSDRGTENNGVANVHTLMRQRLDPELNGTLQHRWDKDNVKAEGAWSQIRRQWSPGFESMLENGLNNGCYDPEDPLER
jgi:hypothetical protein